MASLAVLCRLSARLASQRISADAAVRGFRTSARWAAAQNFTMPALSPTMVEGNISRWNVKEGDSFVAGDVLLEIETDKATMDVEAQEDGILMKIMQGDGSKAVQVGVRIAVIAEAGDDLSALEIPPDEAPSAGAKGPEPAKSEAEAPKEEKKTTDAPTGTGGKIHKQTYPLFPSVAQLVAEKGLDEAAIAKIPSTGPSGRLLKGDVLAYLGEIPASRPAAISERFEQLSHLDLSNIRVAEKKVPPPPKKEEHAAAPVPEDIEIVLSISLEKVIRVQKKIQATLDTHIPLSTFIARAADFANDGLPATPRLPTADELFDKVLGLDKAKLPRGSRGFYMPEISALPGVSWSRPASKPSIIDILAAPKKAPRRSLPVSGFAPGANVFSLVVPPADEKRAKVFLSRLRVILEEEPGRLVL